MKNIQVCTLIREARDSLGFTREEVAEFIGVSVTTVARWEKGENRPFFEEVVKLAEMFKKPLEYFIGQQALSAHVTPDLTGVFNGLARHAELIEALLQLPDDNVVVPQITKLLQYELEQYRLEQNIKKKA